MFLVSSAFAQETKIDADQFIGVDNLANYYYIKNSILHKKTTDKVLTYNNIHLGELTSVDITNTLKIVLFYRDFNTVILLDDALNELSNPINFNEILFKNIAFVGTSTNSNLWLFSKDDQQLLIWNYQTKKTILSKQITIDFNFLHAFSSYHYIWLVSDTNLLKYNAYGSFIEEMNIKNIEKPTVFKDGFVYKKNNELIKVNSINESIIIPINKELEFQDFYLKNDFLYFFDGNIIYKQEFSKK